MHSLGAPTWPLTAQNHSGARQLSSFFLHAHSTNKLSGIQHPDPYKFWLGALGGQTMVFDHLTFYCFPPLQPLALNTFRPRRSGASLGQTVPTGERMGLGIATVTTCDEDVPKGTRPPRHLASSVANAGCSVHSTGYTAG